MDTAVARPAADPPRAARLNLLSRKYKPITTIEELRDAAQLAIQVELTTIPAYLTALYSIKDRTSDAYQALRSVVMEEMLHVNQAANILIGVGGRPVLTAEAVPTYPTFLPSSNKKRTPYVGLFRASPEVFRSVFMGIETPAQFAAPPQDEQYDTIAQLYAALSDGIDTCVKLYGPDAVFQQDRQARQRCDMYLGKFGGRPIEVSSQESAHQAIEQVVRQGEGLVKADGSLKANEGYGEYHYYGARSDGTYGPILGKPLEPSHYVKFLRVADAASFPDTLPIISNPRISDFSNQKAVNLARSFNKAYSLMLRTLEISFHALPSSVDPYFQVTLPMMHRELATLASKLMRTTAHKDGDSAVGPNAAPTFEWDPVSSLEDVLGSLRALDAKPKAAQAALSSTAVPFVATEDARPSADIDDVIGSLIRDFVEISERARRAGLPI